MLCHIPILLFVFSSFVTGSSLKSEKSTLQLVGISRRIRWMHVVAVNWSSTSHLSQEEDRLCSRSVNRMLVKMLYFKLLRACLFRGRSCKVRNTRESRAKGVGENRSAVSLLAWIFGRPKETIITPQGNNARGIFQARANNAWRVNQFGCLTSCLPFHLLQWWLLVPAGHSFLIVWQLVIVRLWLLCKFYLIFLFSIDFAREWLWRQIS